MNKRLIVFVSLTGLIVLSGCRTSGPSVSDSEQGQADGSLKLAQQLHDMPVVQSTAEWSKPDIFDDQDWAGLIVDTVHYRIYTTLEDPLILRQTPMFLESAYRSYGRMMGRAPELSERLEVYLFKNRQQWEQYTRFLTGPASEVFLKIQAGAYYFKDRCVAYHLGRRANFAVLAHEGWHQFSHQVFQYRLPAWVDEGMATNFEAYQWTDGQVTFPSWINGGRLVSLKRALASGRFFSLSDLLSLDAGRVVMGYSQDGEVIGVGPVTPVEAYYAQVYALVRFLREEEYGKRLIALRRLLDDGRLGRWVLPERLRAVTADHDNPSSRQWNSQMGMILFKQYLGEPGGELENAYRLFCRKITYAVKQSGK